MSATESSEKPARNLAIRKFSELTAIKNLDEALSHLSEKELNEAVSLLYKNHPRDNIIARKAKTLEMTRLIDEIKSLLTQGERSYLLDALRLESVDLENQISMTKKAIEQRAIANKFIYESLAKIQRENDFDKAISLATYELFDAIEGLSKADPSVYEEKHKFLLMIKELYSLKDKILARDKATLTRAIQSSDLEMLRQALAQAKESIRLYQILTQQVEKYTEPHYFSKAFEKDQEAYIAAAKSFFKPKAKNAAKLAKITLCEFLVEKIGHDENITAEEKGNDLHILLSILKDNTDQENYPALVTTFEKTMLELENTSFISKKTHMEAFQGRIEAYLENKKLNAKERKLVTDIQLYHQEIMEENVTIKAAKS